MRSVVLMTISSLILTPAVWADPTSDALDVLRQQVAQLTATVQELTTTLQAQQQRLAQLAQGQTPLAQTTTPPPSVSGARLGGGNIAPFNPEIGVVADMVGKLSESSADGEGNDKLSVREIELVFGHPIDPYSRLDTTITFSDVENPDIEEAYITHWGLPGELKAKIGRMRPKIGKASAMHGDSLDTVDEPLVVSKYLGKEGLFRTGVELTGFLPTPWTVVTHELTAGVMEGGVGDGGTLFGSSRRRPSFYTHLKNFWELSDMTNAELGATYLVGSKDADARFEVNAFGLDTTLMHHFTPTNRLKWQSEAYLQDRKESFAIADSGTRTNFDRNPWGLYTLLDYRVSPRIGVGGRVDYVEPVDLDPHTRARHGDAAYSSYLTLYQSEFSRWRLQFRHTDFAAGGDDNSVFVQGTVAIGVHKHQLQ